MNQPDESIGDPPDEPFDEPAAEDADATARTNSDDHDQDHITRNHMTQNDTNDTDDTTRTDSIDEGDTTHGRRSFLATALVSPAVLGGAYGLYETEVRASGIESASTQGTTGEIGTNLDGGANADVDTGTDADGVRPDVRIRSLGDQRPESLDDSTVLTADPALLDEIGREVGQQIRIERSANESALYTIGGLEQESNDRTVRMGQSARDRLVLDELLDESGCTRSERQGAKSAKKARNETDAYVCPPDLLETANTHAPEQFEATIDPVVPNRTLSATEAMERGEFIERLDDSGSATLAVLAPHGGDIEPATADQAEHVGSRLTDATVWHASGWRTGGGAFLRWHVPSQEIDTGSFPKLDSIADRKFDHAVSFHGNCPDRIQIGGSALRSLRAEIRDAIENALPSDSVDVILAEEPYRGDDEETLVNRLTAGRDNGVWIGQSREAREKYHTEIADAVTDVYETRL